MGSSRLRLITGALSLFALVSLGAVLETGCRPTADAGDPTHLIWEEDAQNGFTHLLKLIRVDGIRVMYWNVAWSSFNSGNIIEKNLTELIVTNARPDLLILAEFKPDAVPYEDLEFLHSAYPNYAWVPYWPGSLVGIGVFASQPYSYSGEELLDWAPRSATKTDQDFYKAEWFARAPQEVTHWDRAFARMRWVLAGQPFNLVPVHLLSPWGAFAKRYGSGHTVANLLAGATNPLSNQVDHLREKLVREFGPKLDQEPFLLVGDTNVPKSMLPIPLYDRLEKGMTEVFRGNPFTFPALSSPEREKSPFKYAYVKIDHAFLSKGLEPVGAAVLPLKGSDHYPIYFVIKPSKK